MRDLIERAESAQPLEVGNSNRHLRLMVVIWVVLGVLGMQLLSKLLVRMGLNTESLVDGENLEQER